MHGLLQNPERESIVEYAESKERERALQNPERERERETPAL